MGEIAANRAAFDAEFGKALSLLPVSAEDGRRGGVGHEEGLRRERAVRGIQQVIVHYAAKLPHNVGIPMLLEYGDVLMGRREYRLSLDAIYSYLLGLDVMGGEFEGVMSVVERVAYQTRVMYGLTLCASSFLLQEDPEVHHPDTLRDLVDIQGRMRDAVALSLAHPSLYWLSFNGTLHIFRLATTLSRLGFSAEALPFLLYAALALETHTEYGLPKYLPWRVQVTTAVCNAYADMSALGKAVSFVQRTTEKLTALEALFKLDPVPMSEAQSTGFRDAFRLLRTLIFKYTAAGLPTADAVGQRLAADFGEDAHRLLALTEALQSPQRRTARHSAPSDAALRLLQAAEGLVRDRLPLIERVIDGRKVLREERAADEAEAVERGVSLDELLAERAEREAAEAEAKAAEEAERAAKEATKKPARGKSATKKGAAAAPVEEAPPEKYKDTPEMCAAFDAAVAAVPIQLAHKLTEMAFNYEQWDLFAKLRASAALRTSQDGDAHGRQDIAAVAELLAALREMEENMSDETQRKLVDTVDKWYAECAFIAPDLLTDVGTLLWTQSRDALEGADTHSDKDAELAQTVLLCIHKVFQVVNLDDPALRLVVALRLAGLLEECGDLHAAAAVLRGATEVATRFRGTALSKTRGEKDEALRWISGSASQPTEEATAYTKRMEEVEQLLACLHADVTLKLFRVELGIGLLEQQELTTRRVGKVTREISVADRNAESFGGRTTAAATKDAARLARAAEQPTHPARKERELLAAVDKNPYQRALLLIAAAPLHEERHHQERMLRDAAAALTEAREMEEALFAGATKRSKERRTAPPPPKVLCRSPTTVTMTSPRLHLSSNRKPASYKVFGKPFGVGVSMAMNATSTEYSGLGKPLAIGERVTVEGLKPNDTYIFSVAVFDAKNKLIGELGESTPEIPMLLPLPLYLCWSYLCFFASQLGCAPVARLAGSTVMEHFVVRTPSRPLWEAHPADAERLDRKHADKAALPLLRATVHVAFLWVGKLATPALDMPPRDQRTLYLEDQVVRLKAARRLGTALQVAGMLQDYGLIMEGAIRMYNLLAPLLALKNKSPFLLKSLLTCYTIVQGVARDISLRNSGTKEMRYAAARTTACMLYEMIGLSQRCVPPRPERDVSVHLAKLECDLLKVFEAELAGGDSGVGTAYELRTLQDVLLAHPSLQQFAGEGSAVAARLAAPAADAHAAILPILRTQPAEAVWAKLMEFKEAEGYWEMAARTIETAAQRGTPLPQLQEWVAVVLGELKERSRVPADDVQFPRWTLTEAAEAVVVADGSVVLREDDESALMTRVYGGPAIPEGLTAEEAEAKSSELSAAKSELLATRVTERQRAIAAATLLQARVLPLLRRRRRVKDAGALLAAAGLWTARIHALLGSLVAADLRAERHKRVERERLREALGLVGGGEAPVAAVEEQKATTPAKSKSTKKAKEVPPPPEEAGPKVAQEVAALRHFACGIELAARGGHWHQVQAIARDVWNVGRPLVNNHPELITEVPVITWVQKAWEPPAATAAPAAGGKKDGKKGGKAGAPAAAPPADAATPKMVWTAEGGEINLPRALRVALLRCLELVAAVREGRLVYARLVAEEAQAARDAARVAAERKAREGDPERPGTAMTLATDSGFSVGSDAVPTQWFAEQDDIDMGFYSRLALMGMNVMQHAKRWHAVYALGDEFNRISDEFFAERVLPYMMMAAPHVGNNLPQLQLALQRVVRDKNQALDELHRVRGYVRDRLATVPLLSTSPARKAKKAAGSAFKGNAGRLKALEQMSTTSNRRRADTENASNVTGATARTGRTKATTKPDHIALPDAYAKVIETLRERQEKVLQVQATNELGDVHAHFGAWTEAVQLWNDALDTIVGPYQVVKCWRPHMERFSGSEVLTRYGLPWVLMAGGVLAGKLVRFGYPHDLGTQLEAARLGAQLLSSVFTASATHPQRALGLATYTPVEIWEGVNPLEDPYATPLTDLLAGCDAIASCLLDAGLALSALPVLSLYEHLALHAARDVAETLHCRQLRIDACCQLGLLAEASRILLPALAGRHLPDVNSHRELVPVDLGTGARVEVELPTEPLDARLPASADVNRAVVDFIAEAELPTPLRVLYGKYIVCRLLLRRAQWLAAVGALPNQWKATDPQSGQEVPAEQQLEAVEPRCLEAAATLLHSVTVEAKTDYDAAKKAQLMGLPPPTTKDKSKDGKKDGKTGGKSGRALGKGGPKGGAAAVDAEAEGGRLMDPPEGGYVMSAEDHEAIARAQLLLASVQRLQWRDAKATTTLAALLEYIAAFANSSHGMAADNDFIDRTALGPRLWMAARKAISEAYLFLGHTKYVHRMAAAVAEESKAVKEVWTATAVQGYDAAAYAVEGATSAAIRGYRAVLATYRKLGLEGTLPAARIMMEYAALLDRLGYRKSSATVDDEALEVLQALTHSLGLREAREHPELVNLFAVGTALLAEALRRASVRRMREREYRGARDLAREALDTARYGRSLPGLHVDAARVLARCERHMLLPPPSDPYKATVPEMRSARNALARALTVGMLDGGHAHGVLRAVLLEAAALLLANRELGAANEMLQASHHMTLRMQKLHFATHTVDGVAMANIPQWASEVVASREAHLIGARGSALPTDRKLPDSEAGRLLLMELLNLRRRTVGGSLEVMERQQAQAAELHRVLKAACPKYATECCLPAVPVLRPGVQPSATAEEVSAAAAPTPAPTKGGAGKGGSGTAAPSVVPHPLAPGLVVVQWHEQDGCWQDNESWVADGELAVGEVTDEALLSAEPAPAYVAMLFVAVPSGEAATEEELTESGANFGDKAYPVGAVKAMARRVKELRIRAEEGGKDGQPLMSARAPPEAEELADLMRELGSFLRQDMVEEEGMEEQRLLSVPGVPGVEEPPAQPPAPEELPAYVKAGPELLPKLEALLNLDDGVCGVDAELADWLHSVLHPN